VARLKRHNRIAVFLRSQNLSSGDPAHHVSKVLASLVVAHPLARYVNEQRTAIQLTTDESWTLIKDRFRQSSRSMPRLLPALPYYGNFAAAYPPMNYESDGHRRQEELWMSAERF